jgi:adenine deaminase
MEEALEKIEYGMKIQIREGSAAKNFEALVGLLEDHADDVLFCSDDKHPDDLAEGHINQLVKRAVAKGHDVLKVLKNVILNPINHYNLEVGSLKSGDPADMIVVDSLESFNVLQTYVNGVLVAEHGKTLIHSVEAEKPNLFLAEPVSAEDIAVSGSGRIKVIEAYDGELITGVITEHAKLVNGNAVSDIENDILKIVVLNRYEKGVKPAVAFIKGFGLKSGALASSVAHDSHNVVAVGTSDEEIVKAMNLVIDSKGGVAVVQDDFQDVLPLPVAGLMSTNDGFEVAEQYSLIDKKAHELGSKLRAPFMTMSFMALLVIPDLKLSDKGLFDGTTFSFTSLFE